VVRCRGGGEMAAAEPAEEVAAFARTHGAHSCCSDRVEPVFVRSRKLAPTYAAQLEPDVLLAAQFERSAGKPN
jgi:hypothetical protein